MHARVFLDRGLNRSNTRAPIENVSNERSINGSGSLGESMFEELKMQIARTAALFDTCKKFLCHRLALQCISQGTSESRGNGWSYIIVSSYDVAEMATDNR